MLSRLYKGTCMHYEQFSTGLLKNSGPIAVMEADTDSMQDIRHNYETRFGPVRWLDSRRARQLSTAAFYAARYNAADRYLLIVSVMGQALERGLDYVLSRVSPQAREMMNRSRRVLMELHRAYGFIRFEPVRPAGSSEVLVGKAEFRHDICDLILRYFSRRFARQPVYLQVGNQVFFLQNNTVQVKDLDDVPFLRPTESFSEMWEAYYDSQSIEGRKNPALARKHLPKKYWSWIPEGQKLK